MVGEKGCAIGGRVYAGSIAPVPHRDLPIHQRIFRLLKAAGKEFASDMGIRFAAALSFYTLFSLVPLLFLVVAVVGFVSADSALVGADCTSVTIADIPDDPANPLDRMLVQVHEVAGGEVSEQLARLTCQAAEGRRQALGIGIALAAFSASSVFLHVQAILNLIFQAPEEKTRGIANLVVQRGIALGWALLLSVLVLAPLVAVAGVNFLQDLIDVPWLRSLIGVGVPLTSLLMLVVVVALTFQFLSRTRVRWQAARRGGLFTAVVGLVGAFLVGLYLRNFGRGGALGAVGGVAILLFFFNLMWVIYLFGAEVTKVYADYLEHGDLKPPTAREADRATASPTGAGEDAGPLRNGVVAFAIGALLGWTARRRK